MEIRRVVFGAALRLGVVLSTIAAVLVLVVDAVGDVTPLPLAATVAAVAFASSWSLTGRVLRTAPATPRHRVSVVRLRQPVH